MSRHQAQDELYDLMVKQFTDLLDDPKLSPADRIKAMKELREFLKDNGTTASTVPKELTSIVQSKLEDAELDDEWDDPDDSSDEFDARLRVAHG